MGTPSIGVGVLTSSRADFGIYLPLLQALKMDARFDLKLIVFGTHLSKFHGFSAANIEDSGFEISYKVPSMLLTDDVDSIATAYALTVLKFADFWSQHRKDFDIVFCLGDRYEMAAAVSAAIPYGVEFAHIHGGETTLGAIDNIYRDQITLASRFHFVAAQQFKERIINLIGDRGTCVVSGSLSLDNLNNGRLLSIVEFKEKWGIDLSSPSVLVTIHPETVNFQKNDAFATEIFAALSVISQDYHIIITMPNADTNGQLYRERFAELKQRLGAKVSLIENFGTQSYFTCMKHVNFIIGNTSSGLIEAPSFQKYVINVGNRQLGRLAGDNVIHVPFNRENIVSAAKEIGQRKFEGINPYYQKNAAAVIINALKSYYASLS